MKMTLTYTKHKNGLWYFRYIYRGWGFVEIRRFLNPFCFGVIQEAYDHFSIEVMNIKIPGYFTRNEMLKFSCLAEKLARELDPTYKAEWKK